MSVLLFDLDGVLVNSLAVYYHAWSAWARTYGVDPEEIWKDSHGKRPAEVIARVAPALDQAEAFAFFQERLAAEAHRGVPPMPGAVELLSCLPRDCWAVVSSGHRDVVLRTVAEAGLPPPPVLVAAEDVTTGKPDPSCFLAAAAQLGAGPGDCTVVEDAPVGLQAARAAGMHAVAVATTHPPGELQSADRVFATLKDAVPYLLQVAVPRS